MYLLIHAGIKVNPCLWKGPLSVWLNIFKWYHDLPLSGKHFSMCDQVTDRFACRLSWLCATCLDMHAWLSNRHYQCSALIHQWRTSFDILAILQNMQLRLNMMLFKILNRSLLISNRFCCYCCYCYYCCYYCCYCYYCCCYCECCCCWWWYMYYCMYYF